MKTKNMEKNIKKLLYKATSNINQNISYSYKLAAYHGHSVIINMYFCYKVAVDCKVAFFNNEGVLYKYATVRHYIATLILVVYFFLLFSYDLQCYQLNNNQYCISFTNRNRSKLLVESPQEPVVSIKTFSQKAEEDFIIYYDKIKSKLAVPQFDVKTVHKAVAELHIQPEPMHKYHKIMELHEEHPTVGRNTPLDFFLKSLSLEDRYEVVMNLRKYRDDEDCLLADNVNPLWFESWAKILLLMGDQAYKLVRGLSYSEFLETQQEMGFIIPQNKVVKARFEKTGKEEAEQFYVQCNRNIESGKFVVFDVNTLHKSQPSLGVKKPYINYWPGDKYEFIIKHPTVGLESKLADFIYSISCEKQYQIAKLLHQRKLEILEKNEWTSIIEEEFYEICAKLLIIFRGETVSPESVSCDSFLNMYEENYIPTPPQEDEEEEEQIPIRSKARLNEKGFTEAIDFYKHCNKALGADIYKVFKSETVHKSITSLGIKRPYIDYWENYWDVLEHPTVGLKSKLARFIYSLDYEVQYHIAELLDKRQAEIFEIRNKWPDEIQEEAYENRAKSLIIFQGQITSTETLSFDSFLYMYKEDYVEPEKELEKKSKNIEENSVIIDRCPRFEFETLHLVIPSLNIEDYKKNNGIWDENHPVIGLESPLACFIWERLTVKQRFTLLQRLQKERDTYFSGTNPDFDYAEARYKLTILCAGGYPHESYTFEEYFHYYATKDEKAAAGYNEKSLQETTQSCSTQKTKRKQLALFYERGLTMIKKKKIFDIEKIHEIMPELGIKTNVLLHPDTKMWLLQDHPTIGFQSPLAKFLWSLTGKQRFAILKKVVQVYAGFMEQQAYVNLNTEHYIETKQKMNLLCKRTDLLTTLDDVQYMTENDYLRLFGTKQEKKKVAYMDSWVKFMESPLGTDYTKALETAMTSGKYKAVIKRNEQDNIGDLSSKTVQEYKQNEFNVETIHETQGCLGLENQYPVDLNILFHGRHPTVGFDSRLAEFLCKLPGKTRYEIACKLVNIIKMQEDKMSLNTEYFEARAKLDILFARSLYNYTVLPSEITYLREFRDLGEKNNQIRLKRKTFDETRGEVVQERETTAVVDLANEWDISDKKDHAHNKGLYLPGKMPWLDKETWKAVVQDADLWQSRNELGEYAKLSDAIPGIRVKCAQILMQGKKKGLQCSRWSSVGGFCQQHYKKRVVDHELIRHEQSNLILKKILIEEKPVTLVAKEDAGRCTGRILTGNRKGELCSWKAVYEGIFCKTHYTEYLTGKNTKGLFCQYIFTTGKRQGAYCRALAVGQGYCAAHQAEAYHKRRKLKTTHKIQCVGIIVNGVLRGSQCNSKAIHKEGFCLNHYRTRDKQKKLCKIKLVENPNKFCCERITLNGVCKVHQKVVLDKPAKMGAQTNQKRCQAKVKTGKNKGQQCARKAAVNGFCLQHGKIHKQI